MMSSDSKIGDDDDFLDAFEGPQGGGDSMVVSPVGSQAKSGHGDYDRYEK